MEEKMDEQCNTNTTAPMKEATKFENLTGEMDRTPGLITEIFQTVSNIENRLGEGNPTCAEDCEKKPEPTSAIERATSKARLTNDDLNSIRNRLISILDLF